MKLIDKDNKIFKSNDYVNDKLLFAIFEKKINDANAKIMSDEENYIITNESEERAPWIWTKDNFDRSKLKEIEELIRLYLIKDKMTFTCKKELYNALLEDNFELIDRTDYFEMGFMKCTKLKDTKQNDGRLDKAKKEERELIANYIYEFDNFMDESVRSNRPTTEEELKQYYLEEADKEIDSDEFFVLRNAQDKIVCMAHYKTSTDGTAKLGLAYTPVEERGKGYAAKIVHDITGILLNKGFIPVLYTDQNYPNSNKAYYNAGYKNGGTLVNFSCNKRLVKEETRGISK